MSRVEKIYENIKANNDHLQDEVHLFFHLVMNSDFEEITESRFTSVFLIKMFYAFFRGANIDIILSEMRNLENPDINYKRMKPPTLFKYMPLKGLWHKHFEQIGLSSMSLNIKSQINSNPNFYKDFIDIYNDPNLTLNEKVSKLAYLSSSKQYLDRIENGKLTGEWIIYHIHNHKNYYLNIGKHNDGDSVLAEEIRAIALLEFPQFRGEIPLFE
ncbi:MULTISPECIES: hypothetical protein [Acinetobacter calcoaceticus/baumannii complex]|nr:MULTISPECIES: hypothetical protein [Acinetobacter calcoaceticus/baumannii complex]MBJ9727077.1 hypothetical protein [Acinetobacter nosocomialis]QNX86476.1 hypothetical protein IC772_12615 [Acinetobacter seifertii]